MLASQCGYVMDAQLRKVGLDKNGVSIRSNPLYKMFRRCRASRGKVVVAKEELEVPFGVRLRYITSFYIQKKMALMQTMRKHLL
jgi:hypothetical protein